MIWFSEDVLSLEMIYENFFGRLCSVPLEDGDDEDTVGDAAMPQTLVNAELRRQMSTGGSSQPGTSNALDGGPAFGEFSTQSGGQQKPAINSALTDQRIISTHLRPFFTPDGLVTKCLHVAMTKYVLSIFSLINLNF